MTQQASQATPAPRKTLPVVNGSVLFVGQDAPLDDTAMAEHLASYEEAEKRRLGIRQEREHWVDSMIDPTVRKHERESVTLLISGLTKAQDFLVEGALRGQGYNVRTVACPDQDGFQAGKEYGNRGQCNPTYFTVGNLVKYLIDLRDKDGLSTEAIIRDYVFFTAGACGPCRFGMYATEYRKALRDAGFDGFRVMLFQQQGGLEQGTGDDDVGIELNAPFFISILKALVSGDVMNAMSYRIRPYEVVPGATDRAVEEAKKICYQALLKGNNIFAALLRSRKIFEAIKVDKLRPKPRVSIIGEFWAMTTEGDGNYHLQHFLESEGAENDIQLTTAWLLYNIWEVARDTHEREDLRIADEGRQGLSEMGEFDVSKRAVALKGAEWGLRTAFQMFALPAGLHGYHLPDMDAVAEVADEHYNNELRGGEGHMEVGKLILNVVKSKATMTLSVKPFGCMPSSGVSDGVQSLITSKYPGTIFCAVETSGDGATNFYSRVQMYLYKARIAAEQELEKAFADTGITRAQAEQFLAENEEYAGALHHSPHKVASAAANLVYEIGPLITKTHAERRRERINRALGSASKAIQSIPAVVRKVATTVGDPEFQQRARYDVELVADLLRGKAKQTYGPLVSKLSRRAFFENNSDFPQTATMSEPMAAE